MDNSEAYRILTRVLMNMHHTERTVLDTHENYQPALDAVKAWEYVDAVCYVKTMRTEAGDAWRKRQDLPFCNY